MRIPEFLLRWLVPMNLTDEQLGEIAARYQISAATLKLMVAARRRQAAKKYEFNREGKGMAQSQQKTKSQLLADVMVLCENQQPDVVLSALDEAMYRTLQQTVGQSVADRFATTMRTFAITEGGSDPDGKRYMAWLMGQAVNEINKKHGEKVVTVGKLNGGELNEQEN